MNLSNESFNMLYTHGLCGYIFKENSLFKDDILKKQWQKQFLINSIFKNKTREIIKLLDDNGIEVILIKGISFLDTLYKDIGTRTMSDIDLYFENKEDYNKARKLIITLRFLELKTNKWKANNYKTVLVSKHNEIEIPIELHHKLLACKDYSWNTIKHPIFNAKELKLEDNLVYLIGHLAYQHTFMRLNWLFDIYLLVKDNYKVINYKHILTLAKNLNLESSILTTFIILDKSFNLKTPTILKAKLKERKLKYGLITWITSDAFLKSPRSHLFKYYLLKFLLKDSVLESISYTFHWTLNRAWKK